ncbi:hypothetical protein Pcinc_003893 [Petrolisthes cinctipes]|uniref:Uncharacterized protein n=1 Tax=Petrolisthes cinctipes TaxID=88211 RepID=A0AAE1GGY2_PETCI|nr:hypothetical protein Pcinc_003893 [Petrolisthes cinctipes]
MISSFIPQTPPSSVPSLPAPMSQEASFPEEGLPLSTSSSSDPLPAASLGSISFIVLTPLPQRHNQRPKQGRQKKQKPHNPKFRPAGSRYLSEGPVLLRRRAEGASWTGPSPVQKQT